MKQAQANFIED
jgi:chromosome segregation ATPase